jgi:hypothetical protein
VARGGVGGRGAAAAQEDGERRPRMRKRSNRRWERVGLRTGGRAGPARRWPWATSEGRVGVRGRATIKVRAVMEWRRPYGVGSRRWKMDLE